MALSRSDASSEKEKCVAKENDMKRENPASQKEIEKSFLVASKETGTELLGGTHSSEGVRDCELKR